MTRITYKSFARLRRKAIPASVLERPRPTEKSVEFVSGKVYIGGVRKEG